VTDSETLVLMLALQNDPHLRYRTVYTTVRSEAAWSILNRLREQGAVEHVGYDHWRITERGRIAIGLAMAKDSKLAKLASKG